MYCRACREAKMDSVSRLKLCTHMRNSRVSDHVASIGHRANVKALKKREAAAASATPSVFDPMQTAPQKAAMQKLKAYTFILRNSGAKRPKKNVGRVNLWPYGHLPEANGPMTPLWSAGRPAMRPVAVRKKPKKKPLSPVHGQPGQHTRLMRLLLAACEIFCHLEAISSFLCIF